MALWRRNKLTLIGVNIEVLTGVDQCEVLGSLNNKEDDVVDIEHEWRSPVHNVVDITLGGCAHDQVVVLHAHINNSFSKVKVVIHFMKAVIN